MVKTNRILVSLCTRGRYENYLPMALISIAMQTRKPDKVIIYDDNDTPKDLREIPAYNYIFNLYAEKQIDIFVQFGQHKGQHFNDESANTAGFDLVWRFDDDEFAEPDCLELLEKQMTDDVGAVGPLVLIPQSQPKPFNAFNLIHDLNLPNLQWFNWTGNPKSVEHLHSSFLYRANIAHFDLRLSQVSFRGETMFSHELFLKGYKLLIEPKAKVYHFQSNTGGCRTQEQEQERKKLYEHDQWLFNEWLKFKDTGRKLYVLNNGLGDHYMFKQVMTPDKDDYIACCYPELFKEYQNVISIEQAQHLVDIKDYDIYAWCDRNNHKGTLQEAFIKMYENINFKR